MLVKVPHVLHACRSLCWAGLRRPSQLYAAFMGECDAASWRSGVQLHISARQIVNVFVVVAGMIRMNMPRNCEATKCDRNEGEPNECHWSHADSMSLRRCK